MFDVYFLTLSTVQVIFEFEFEYILIGKTHLIYHEVINFAFWEPLES